MVPGKRQTQLRLPLKLWKSMEPCPHAKRFYFASELHRDFQSEALSLKLSVWNSLPETLRPRLSARVKAMLIWTTDYLWVLLSRRAWVSAIRARDVPIFSLEYLSGLLEQWWYSLDALDGSARLFSCRFGQPDWTVEAAACSLYGLRGAA